MKEAAEYRLAKRIKELRAARNMTLQHVSELAGFSKGLLSKVENCIVSPPIATLAKLADVFDVPIGEFFDSGDQNPQMVFFPKAKRKLGVGRRSSFNYDYELLAPNRRHRDMEAMAVSIEGKKYKFALLDHSGEQFIYLLDGEMDYIVGDKTYQVRPGDCLYFDARQPHGPKLQKHQRAHYIVVFSHK
jgi:transcriptional regulator with XRE-family HTH domain